MSQPEPSSFLLRPIRPADDPAVASLIRTVMPEFGAVGAGFAIEDPEVDRMAETYAAPRSSYFVLERNGEVVGGAGVAPLRGGPADTCELQKMYFLPLARSLGWGRLLLERCLEEARRHGFTRCYLETLGRMDAARRLYERAGFRTIPGPLGATGHHACNAFYLLEL